MDVLISDPSERTGTAAVELCYQQQCTRSILLQTPSTSVWELGGVHSAFPFNFVWLLIGIFLCFSGAGESGKSTIVKQMK